MKGKSKFSSVETNQNNPRVQIPKPESKPKETNHNKIKVFTIKKKDETTLIKRTYLVDISLTIPVPVKGSRGPKKLWVPKSS